MGDKKFSVDGKLYDIPAADVSAFLNDMPDAVEVAVYEAGGKKYGIPLPDVNDFLKDMPDAKLFGEVEKKSSNGSTSPPDLSSYTNRFIRAAKGEPYLETYEPGGDGLVKDTPPAPKETFEQWKARISKVNPSLVKTDGSYNLRGAYEAGLEPELADDGKYHLGSRNPYTGELLKTPSHPTWNKLVEGEKAAGYKIVKKGGKYFSELDDAFTAPISDKRPAVALKDVTPETILAAKKKAIDENLQKRLEGKMMHPAAVSVLAEEAEREKKRLDDDYYYNSQEFKDNVRNVKKISEPIFEEIKKNVKNFPAIAGVMAPVTERDIAAYIARNPDERGDKEAVRSNLMRERREKDNDVIIPADVDWALGEYLKKEGIELSPEMKLMVREDLLSSARNYKVEKQIEEKIPEVAKKLGIVIPDEKISEITSSIKAVNDSYTQKFNDIKVNSKMAAAKLLSEFEAVDSELFAQQEARTVELQALINAEKMSLADAVKESDAMTKQRMDNYNRYSSRFQGEVQRSFTDLYEKTKAEYSTQLAAITDMAKKKGINIDGNLEFTPEYEAKIKAVYDLSTRLVTAGEKRRTFDEWSKLDVSQKFNSALSSGVGDMIESIAGTFMNYGSYEFGQRLKMSAGKLQDEMPDPGEFTSASLSDPTWWYTRGVRMLPFTISLMAPAIATGFGVGAAATAAGWSGFASLIAGSTSAALVSRILEAQMEAGGSFNDVIERGGSVDEARKQWSFVHAKNYNLLLSDVAQFGFLFSKGGILLKGIEAIVGAGFEGSEEVYQEYINRKAQDGNTSFSEFVRTPVAREVFTLGAVNGLAFQGIGAANNSMNDAAKRRHLMALLGDNPEFIGKRRQELYNAAEIARAHGVITQEEYVEAINSIKSVSGLMSVYKGLSGDQKAIILESAHSINVIDSQLEKTDDSAQKDLLKKQRQELMANIENTIIGKGVGYLVDGISLNKSDLRLLMQDDQFKMSVAADGRKITIYNDEQMQTEVDSWMSDIVGKKEVTPDAEIQAAKEEPVTSEEDIEMRRSKALAGLKTQAGVPLDEINDFKISDGNILLGIKRSEDNASYEGTSLQINGIVSVEQIQEMEQFIGKEKTVEFLVARLKEFNARTEASLNQQYDNELKLFREKQGATPKAAEPVKTPSEDSKNKEKYEAEKVKKEQALKEVDDKIDALQNKRNKSLKAGQTVDEYRYNRKLSALQEQRTQIEQGVDLDAMKEKADAESYLSDESKATIKKSRKETATEEELSSALAEAKKLERGLKKDNTITPAQRKARREGLRDVMAELEDSIEQAKYAKEQASQLAAEPKSTVEQKREEVGAMAAVAEETESFSPGAPIRVKYDKAATAYNKAIAELSKKNISPEDVEKYTDEAAAQVIIMEQALAELERADQEAALNKADEAKKAADELEKTGPAADVKNRTREAIKKSFNLDDKQADAAMAIFNTYAKAWARRRGKPVSEFYDNIQFAKKDKFSKATKNALKSILSFDENVGVSPIGFYSTVEKALSSIKQDKGTPEQFKAMLLKNGAKQAEMDWMGWDNTFSSQNSITKSDVQSWINENKIDIQQVVYSGPTEADIDTFLADEAGEGFTREQAREYLSNDEEDETQYSGWQLSGGKNYRELLLTMPHQTELDVLEFLDKINLQGKSNRTALEDAELDRLLAKEKKLKARPKKNEFQSSHFDEPNILAHIRINERVVNGERVLFIEEIQSDWAQKGRKYGFKNESDSKRIRHLLSKANLSSKEIDELQSLRERNVGDINAVPNMPFAKTDQWVNLALRKVMRYAAENGFDRIAWTNGDMQSKRYDISKQVDSIFYRKDGKTSSDNMQMYTLKLTLNGGGKSHLHLRGDELEDNVGKEVAQKILNEEGTKIYSGTGSDQFVTGTELSGLDLKVGGEGMKTFYDGIIPSAASKLGRPFGAKVEDMELPLIKQYEVAKNTEDIKRFSKSGYTFTWNGDKISKQRAYEIIERGGQVEATPIQSSTVQSLPVTDSMRESVMQGVPLFQSEKEGLKQNKSGDTQKFFSDVVTGADEKFIPKKPWSPIMVFTAAEKAFNKIYTKFKGNFDEHIATSIPGFRDVQIKKGAAIAKILKDGGLVIDIGGSEGGFIKAITESSGGKIKSVNVDINSDMQAAHNATPVEGSEFVLEAFYESYTDEDTGVTYVRHIPKEKADVVHESMVFQFISPERAQFIKEVADNYLKDDGIAIFEEKVVPESMEQWQESENNKDQNYKSQYYEVKQITQKSEEVLIGMKKNQTAEADLVLELQKNFKYVSQYWDSGNFKGYAASNNKAKLDAFIASVGDTTTDYSTRDITGDNAVVKDDKTEFKAKLDSEVIGDSQELLKEGESVLASIVFGKNSEAVVTGYSGANILSFFHELGGHYMFEDIIMVANDKNMSSAARSAAKAELQAVVDMYNKNTGKSVSIADLLSNRDVYVAVHEIFSEGYEKWIATGEKAGFSSAMQELFKKFTEWLKAFIERVKSNGVEITPEVEEIYQRITGIDTSSVYQQGEFVEVNSKASFTQYLQDVSGYSKRDAAQYAGIVDAVAKENVKKNPGTTIEDWYSQNYKIAAIQIGSTFVPSGASVPGVRNSANTIRFISAILGSERPVRKAVSGAYFNAIVSSAKGGNKVGLDVLENVLRTYNLSTGQSIKLPDIYGDAYEDVADFFDSMYGLNTKDHRFNRVQSGALVYSLAESESADINTSRELADVFDDMRTFFADAVSTAVANGLSVPGPVLAEARRAASLAGISESRFNANKAKASVAKKLFTSKAGLLKISESSDWQIITAYKEGVHSNTKSEFAQKAHHELRAKLDNLRLYGYDYMEIPGGVYKGESQGAGFVILGLDLKSSMKLGVDFGQQSILSKEGIVYSSTGVYAPSSGEIFVGADAVKKSGVDGYTIVHLDNDMVFAMDIDWSRRVRSGAKIMALSPEDVASVRVSGEKGVLISGDNNQYSIDKSVVPDNESQYVNGEDIYPAHSDPAEVRDAAETILKKDLADAPAGRIRVYVPPGKVNEGRAHILANKIADGLSGRVSVNVSFEGIGDSSRPSYFIIDGTKATPLVGSMSSKILQIIDNELPGAVPVGSRVSMSAREKSIYTGALYRALITDMGYKTIISKDSSGKLEVVKAGDVSISRPYSGPLFMAQPGNSSGKSQGELLKNMKDVGDAIKSESTRLKKMHIGNRVFFAAGRMLFDTGFSTKWLMLQGDNRGKAYREARMLIDARRHVSSMSSLAVVRAMENVFGKWWGRGAERALDKNERALLGRYLTLQRVIEIDTNYDRDGKPRAKHVNERLGLELNKEIAEDQIHLLESGIGYDIFGLPANYDFNRIKDAAKKFQGEVTSALDHMREADLLSSQAYAKLKSDNQFYFKRIFMATTDDAASGSGSRTKSPSSAPIEALDEGADDMLWEDPVDVLSKVISSANNKIYAAKLGRAMKNYFSLHDSEWWGRNASYTKDFVDKMIAEYDERADALANGVSRPDKWIEPEFEKTPLGYEAITFLNEFAQPQRFFLAKDIADEYNANIRLGKHMSKTMELLSWAVGAKVLKAAATGYNQEFFIRNLPLDIIHILLTGHELYGKSMFIGGAKLTKDMLSVAKDAITRGPMAQKYYALGGHDNYLVAEGQFGQSEKPKTKLTGTLGLIGDIMAYTGATSELLTRLSIMKRYLTNYEREFRVKNGRGMTPSERADAELMAVDASINYLDFSQGGYVIKAVDKVIPYLNAGFQVTYGTLRAAKRDPVVMAGKLLELSIFSAIISGWNLGVYQLGLTAASALLKGEPYDDDDKEKKAQNETTAKSVWYFNNMVSKEDKAGNWIIRTNYSYIDDKGQEHFILLKLPKDQSIQLVTGLVDGAMWTSFTGDKSYLMSPQRLTEAMALFRNLGALSTIPPVMRAIYNYNTGIDGYYNSKIWRGNDNVAPFAEYYKDTPEIYKWIGRATRTVDESGEYGGMSPVRMENAMQQLFTRNFMQFEGLEALFSGVVGDAEVQQEVEKTGWWAVKEAKFLRKVVTATNFGEEYEKMQKFREISATKTQLMANDIDAYLTKVETFNQAVSADSGSPLMEIVDKYMDTDSTAVKRAVAMAIAKSYKKANFDTRIIKMATAPADAKAGYVYDAMRSAYSDKDRQAIAVSAVFYPNFASGDFFREFLTLEKEFKTNYMKYFEESGLGDNPFKEK